MAESWETDPAVDEWIDVVHKLQHVRERLSKLSNELRALADSVREDDGSNAGNIAERMDAIADELESGDKI